MGGQASKHQVNTAGLSILSGLNESGEWLEMETFNRSGAGSSRGVCPAYSGSYSDYSSSAGPAYDPYNLNLIGSSGAPCAPGRDQFDRTPPDFRHTLSPEAASPVNVRDPYTTLIPTDAQLAGKSLVGDAPQFHPEYYAKNLRPSFHDSTYYSSGQASAVSEGTYRPFTSSLIGGSKQGHSQVTINVTPGVHTTVNLGGETHFNAPGDVTPPSFNLPPNMMSTPVRTRGGNSPNPKPSATSAVSSLSEGSMPRLCPPDLSLEASCPIQSPRRDRTPMNLSQSTGQSSMDRYCPKDLSLQASTRPTKSPKFERTALNLSQSTGQDSTARYCPPDLSLEASTRPMRSPQFDRTPLNLSMSSKNALSTGPGSQMISKLLDDMSQKETRSMREGLRSFQESRRKNISRI